MNLFLHCTKLTTKIENIIYIQLDTSTINNIDNINYYYKLILLDYNNTDTVAQILQQKLPSTIKKYAQLKTNNIKLMCITPC